MRASIPSGATAFYLLPHTGTQIPCRRYRGSLPHKWRMHPRPAESEWSDGQHQRRPGTGSAAGGAARCRAGGRTSSAIGGQRRGADLPLARGRAVASAPRGGQRSRAPERAPSAPDEVPSTVMDVTLRRATAFYRRGCYVGSRPLWSWGRPARVLDRGAFPVVGPSNSHHGPDHCCSSCCVPVADDRVRSLGGGVSGRRGRTLARCAPVLDAPVLGVGVPGAEPRSLDRATQTLTAPPIALPACVIG
jgi:hypothetical protein